MSRFRLVALTTLTMMAFAGNSLLCRSALKDHHIDAASFTTIRLFSGSLMLWLVVKASRGRQDSRGCWSSAAALFVYAAGFSFAYSSLSAATGALLLFCAVQTTMIGHALWTGERLSRMQIFGLLLAIGGLIFLLSPGLSAPSLIGSMLMLSAGVAWGIYSLHGSVTKSASSVTAGNFQRATILAALTSLLVHDTATSDCIGVMYAVISGALASSLSYVIWYTLLPELRTTTAATVQLSVPVIAATGGVLLLGEPMTIQFLLASIAILAGIAIVIQKGVKPDTPPQAIE